MGAASLLGAVFLVFYYAADLPPLCLVHGVQDTTVLADQSIRLADQLEALGKPCELHLYPGTGHYPGVKDPTPESLSEKLQEFGPWSTLSVWPNKPRENLIQPI